MQQKIGKAASIKGEKLQYRDADVVVIGGGLVGTATCLNLARRGRKVVLLEKGGISEEASGRSIGGVRQQNRAVEEVPIALESLKIWQGFQEELDEDIEYVQGGNIKLICSENELEESRRQQLRESDLGLKTEIISREELLALVPNLSRDSRFIAGKYCASDGHANPLKVGKAIAQAAVREGATVLAHTPVTNIELRNDAVNSVATKEVVFRTDTVVNATNAWAPEIGKMVGISIPIVCKVSQLLVTEPLPPLMKEFITCTGMGYLRQAVRGNIHIGYPSQPTIGFNKKPTYEAFPYVGRGIARYVPRLQSASIIRAWGGITAFTPDGIPIISPVNEVKGFYIAAGLCGHGFCIGPGIGKIMADLIVDGDTSVDLRPFRFSRFQEECLR
jgi:sarcosine oxidase subunit beta